MADCCAAARVRSAFVFRVTRSIRPEGTAAAGPQARAHAAATDSRVLLCAAPSEPERLRADRCGRRANARRRLASGTRTGRGAILPGAVARSLPVSWAVSERIAARMLGVDMWQAGQQMMAKADPGRFRRHWRSTSINHKRAIGAAIAKSKAFSDC